MKLDLNRFTLFSRTTISGIRVCYDKQTGCWVRPENITQTDDNRWKTSPFVDWYSAS